MKNVSPNNFTFTVDDTDASQVNAGCKHLAVTVSLTN